MDRKIPTFAEYKMNPKEDEVVHGHPLPSFSVKRETGTSQWMTSLTHIIEIMMATLCIINNT